MCSMIGATRTPRGDEPRDQLRRERPAGARHLGAAGLDARRRSGRRERPAAGRRSRSGSAARAGEVRGRAAAGSSRRASQSRPPGVRARGSRRDAPPGEHEPLADAATAPNGAVARSGAPRSRTARISSFAGVESRSSSSAPSAPDRRQRRRQRGRGVDDDEVAGREEARQSRKRACTICRRPRSATSSRTSSRASPRASGGSCASRRRQAARRERAHAGLDELARRGSAPLGSSPSISASRPGTLSSGGGRSEMSSPGNASWCIRVRMSPGSTA